MITKLTLSGTPSAGATVGAKITGQTSGATAVVVSSQSFTQGLFAITELELQSVECIFVD